MKTIQEVLKEKIMGKTTDEIVDIMLDEFKENRKDYEKFMNEFIHTMLGHSIHSDTFEMGIPKSYAFKYFEKNSDRVVEYLAETFEEALEFLKEDNIDFSSVKAVQVIYEPLRD